MDGGWGQGWIGVDGSGPGINLVEGNIIKGVGQIVPAYKPAIQVSGANNTVRRNVTIDTRSWALEVSAFGGPASYNQIYNNVFYDSGGCYFQSANGGVEGYNNVVYANNICYKIRDEAFKIYLGTDQPEFQQHYPQRECGGPIAARPASRSGINWEAAPSKPASHGRSGPWLRPRVFAQSGAAGSRASSMRPTWIST